MKDKNYEEMKNENKKDMRVLLEGEISDLQSEIKQLEKEKSIIDVELKNTKNLAQRKNLIDDEKQILNDLEDLQHQLKVLNQFILNYKEEQAEEKSEIINDSEPSLETYETDEKNIDNEPI